MTSKTRPPLCRATRFFIAYCIFCASIAASIGAVKAFDIEFAHYEDGAGKISWCLPAWTGAICSQGE